MADTSCKALSSLLPFHCFLSNPLLSHHCWHAFAFHWLHFPLFLLHHHPPASPPLLSSPLLPNASSSTTFQHSPTSSTLLPMLVLASWHTSGMINRLTSPAVRLQSEVLEWSSMSLASSCMRSSHWWRAARCSMAACWISWRMVGSLVHWSEG